MIPERIHKPRVVKRIQRKRKKGWRSPPNTRYVGRGTKYGNPFGIGDMIPVSKLNELGVNYSPLVGVDGFVKCDRWLAVKAYKAWIEHENLDLSELLLYNNLSCYCRLDQDCHADVLIKKLELQFYATNSVPEQERHGVKIKKAILQLWKVAPPIDVKRKRITNK